MKRLPVHNVINSRVLLNRDEANLMYLTYGGRVLLPPLLSFLKEQKPDTKRECLRGRIIVSSKKEKGGDHSFLICM